MVGAGIRERLGETVDNAGKAIVAIAGAGVRELAISIFFGALVLAVLGWGGVHIARWATQAGYDKMFVTGSILKVYATSTALDVLGPDHRFRTPVYRRGKVFRRTLDGDLFLVGSGDSSFGLRDRPNGTLGFNNAPQIDHNYADTGLGGPALLRNSRPLAGVNDLARKVRAAGIRRVQGNVVVDDRLFETYGGWPDGLMSPIWVNENVIDITSTPTKPGRPAKLDWRPRTAAIRVCRRSRQSTAPARRLRSRLSRSAR